NAFETDGHRLGEGELVFDGHFGQHESPHSRKQGNLTTNLAPSEGRIYPKNHSHCWGVKGTTDSRPMTTRGEPAKSGSALMAARVLGCLSRLPAFTLTMGVFGSEASTLTTVPVPTAVRSSPVW